MMHMMMQHHQRRSVALPGQDALLGSDKLTAVLTCTALAGDSRVRPARHRRSQIGDFDSPGKHWSVAAGPLI